MSEGTVLDWLPTQIEGKICTLCEKFKRTGEFSVRNAAKDGLDYRCKECDSRRKTTEQVKEYNRRWYLANQEKAKAYTRDRKRKIREEAGKQPRQYLPKDMPEDLRYKTYQLKYLYTVTLEQYEDMFAAQQGLCASCRGVPTAKGLVIDHDHKCCPRVENGKTRSCGKCVRGLLCHPCNILLGMARDSEETLLKAIEYLRRYAVQQEEKQSA